MMAQGNSGLGLFSETHDRAAIVDGLVRRIIVR